MSFRTRPNLQAFLDRLNLRSVLLREEQEAILGLPAFAQQVETNSDHVILGELTDHATLVVAGVLARFGQTICGDRQITALHVTGDMANLQSVVEPRATSALQALSPTTVLRVPHQALREISARYPAVAEALWRDSMVDAAVLSQWVINIGRRNARSRIAHLLCETATRYRVGDEKQALQFEFPLTQCQLADATGITSVHVNRTLKTLADAVTITRKAVRITDWELLSFHGEFDSDYLQLDIVPSERLRIAPA